MTPPTPAYAFVLHFLQSMGSGLSSTTICAALAPEAEDLCRVSNSVFGWRTPLDPADVSRCIQLLDSAEAAGLGWRARMPEVGQRFPAWKQLVARWPEVEAAWHADRAVQKLDREQNLTLTGRRKKGAPPFPPSRCWWLIHKLTGERDPYKDRNPHPFAGET